MQPRSVALALALAALAACSRSPAGPGSEESAAETHAAQIEHMYAAVDALQARPEHTAEEVEVQHILLAVPGAGDGAAPARSPREAEELAAELYARSVAGEQFDTLERNHSNDVHPGICRLTALASGSLGTLARADMVRGVGDVAWRLEVGEVGVVAYAAENAAADAVADTRPKSPLGYHLVKRLK